MRTGVLNAILNFHPMSVAPILNSLACITLEIRAKNVRPIHWFIPMIELRSVFWIVSPGCLLLMLLSGCAGPGIKTGNGVAPGADFSRRITFQFLSDHGASLTPKEGYFRDLIGRDILAALNSQRYRYFTNRRTDLLV